jgi:hypothetical protein
MRLTLRTLLAYLDDTLEPLETKTIGQKVSESETAQELISRIKHVTRRRRITTPPATGPNSFDPNLVAEYLDNELSAEQIAELEKICLESDVHLAEVASCHQILTLVLGEPSSVPPMSKERMYALVQGREAIHSRKAVSRAGADSSPSSADADADEMFLLGLPFYRRGTWLRWALPLAAVVLFAIVGIALWQSITPEPPRQVAQAPKEKQEPTDDGDKNATKPTEKENTEKPVKTAEKSSETTDKSTPKTPDGQKPQTEKEPSAPDKKKPEETNPPKKSPENEPSTPALTSFPGRDTPPRGERVEVGKYHISDLGPPSLLVYRDADDWKRVLPGASVSSRDLLLSLPGYASEVRLNCGIHLLLRGHLPEFTPIEDDPKLREQSNPMHYLQECAIQLHKPADVDVDLTLHRGRLFISNHTVKQPGALTVRLRFVNNQVWDLTLQPEAEAIVEMIKHQSFGAPISTVQLCLLQGNASLTLANDNRTLSIPGLAYFNWDNMHPPSNYIAVPITKQQRDAMIRKEFAKRPTVGLPPDAAGMERALKAIHQLMNVDRSPTVVLEGILDKPGKQYPYEHRLAIYCLGALDEIGELMNILSKDDVVNSPDRMWVIVALRRWLDRGPQQSQKLFDPATRKGILIEQLSYTTEQAQRVVDLLRDPSAEQVFSSKEYYEELANDLVSKKVPIAELARWRLSGLAIGMFRLDMPRLKAFNAAVPEDRRRAAMEEVNAMIRENKLPPPPKNGDTVPGIGGKTNPQGSGTKKNRP